MRRLWFLFLFVMLATAQDPIRPPLFPDDSKDDPKLADGTSQKQAILKMEYKQSIEDAKKLTALAGEVQSGLEKGDANVVSLKMIQQLEEIERLSKKIKTRLKRI